MSFLEPGGKVSVVKDGKTVEEIDIETEVTLINTKTNQEYNSDQEAQDDVANVFRGFCSARVCRMVG